ncbi:hypothetical protein SCA6_004104 [Theobroma cacao]
MISNKRKPGYSLEMRNDELLNKFTDGPNSSGLAFSTIITFQASGKRNPQQTREGHQFSRFRKSHRLINAILPWGTVRPFIFGQSVRQQMVAGSPTLIRQLCHLHYHVAHLISSFIPESSRISKQGNEIC